MTNTHPYTAAYSRFCGAIDAPPAATSGKDVAGHRTDAAQGLLGPLEGIPANTGARRLRVHSGLARDRRRGLALANLLYAVYRRAFTTTPA